MIQKIEITSPQHLLIIFLIIYLGFGYNIKAQQSGYVDPISVTQGDTLTFYISTSDSLFDLSIFKIQDIARYLTYYHNIPGKLQTVPDSSFWYGCNWKPTYKLVVPNNWTPGVYRAQFTASNGDSIRAVIFSVKPKVLGSYSNVLLVLSTNTFQAYNNFGGKSLYEFNSNGKRSFKVSFFRPAALPLGILGSADFYKFEAKFINWSAYNNLKLEYASQYDLDLDPNFLSHYSVVFIEGHNEYWTRAERRQFENYINNGGKVIILSGNTCWWQVRFEDNGRTMVCYKDASADPLTGIADSLVTVNWWSPPVNYPENKFTGINFKYSGYVNYNNLLLSSAGFGDYAAFNTHYWVFNGTGLKDGDQFGYSKAIVGYETDGTPFAYKNGIPTVFGADSTPSNYRIFGISPAIPVDTSIIKYGHATMGMYYAPNGGAVFNAATTDWSDGLYSDTASGIKPDPVVDRITKNVLNKFLENKFPPEILSWSPAVTESVWINYDPEVINKRDILALPNTSALLSIFAKDPYNKKIQFYWTQDGNIVGANDSVYNFQNVQSNQKKFVVTAHVYNNQDTASLSWNLFSSQLVITSTPDTVVKPNQQYSYKIKAFNYYNDTLTYHQLNMPAWLSINKTGTIIGTAPNVTGNYPVAFEILNQHNQYDYQQYNLKVTNSITGIRQTIQPYKFELNQNFPNPFNPSTTIKYSIPQSSFVTIKIYDVLGNEIETMVNKQQPAGSYSIRFSINNKQLSSGIYFYQLRASVLSGNAGEYISTKKMILLK
ncbi:MAG: putative Ig domain-containing protein [Bacteroidetes bacterium]|nr:putative Ig domain-containing protein [Bacteroidota bacterium]